MVLAFSAPHSWHGKPPPSCRLPQEGGIINSNITATRILHVKGGDQRPSRVVQPAEGAETSILILLRQEMITSAFRLAAAAQLPTLFQLPARAQGHDSPDMLAKFTEGTVFRCRAASSAKRFLLPQILAGSSPTDSNLKI